ncbi:hypothetical protein PR202_ga11265 [Eleusine coracana subsp. coracana]|uniref:C2 domain-containing protein n=1 Tax=Eleusine coracana subsp. coracana TaxID=191504 RepID=A0AAV5C940_ELECO|nr:hypothetical protein QOZ80_5AG0404920 [Eleusine coracana subsp. coracana]GJM94603.1 hypothetical protein PR202_ga11265 [Eleusine coracana subsp. coracana]
MALSSYQVLEVTLISAKDLKRVTFFSKMRVYAVASISGGDPRLPTHRTYADREGGRNPMWHAPLRFTIPRAAAGDHHHHALALHVLLRAERRAFGFGDRDVGEVVVPVADLAAGEQQRHLSYQVRRPVSGRHRGVLHISYRLTDVDHAAAAPPPYGVRHHHHHPYAHDAEATAKRSQHKSGGSAAVTAYHQQHSGHQYLPSYSGPYPHHHQYGYAGAYGYGAVPHHGPAYGYGQGGAAARHDGGAGLGLGMLGGAVGGMIIGDMLADADVIDGVGF